MRRWFAAFGLVVGITGLVMGVVVAFTLFVTVPLVDALGIGGLAIALGVFVAVCGAVAATQMSRQP
jgi:hypothetical protein